jgi:hypothetical protein
MSIRQCIAVRKDSKGYCRCASFGPKGSTTKTFKDLCREANLPMKIGRTNLGGYDMKRKRGFRDLDFLDDIKEFSLDDLDEGLFDLNFISMEDVKTLGTIGVAAGVATAGYSFLEQKFIAEKVQNDYLKTAIKAGLGIVLGAFANRYNRNVAYGIAAGLIGSAVGDLVASFMKPKTEALPGKPVKGLLDVPSAEEIEASVSGLSDDTGIPQEITGIEEQKLLTGIEEQKLYGIEEQKLYGLDEEPDTVDASVI